MAAADRQLDSAQALRLLEAARQARKHAYAPYSNFPVGAALLSLDGSLYTGCNVENAAYGLSHCAERTALVKAVSEGVHEFVALAVTGRPGKACLPCGACRQTLVEFAPRLLVIWEDGPGSLRSRPLNELLQEAFSPDSLRPGKGEV